MATTPSLRRWARLVVRRIQDLRAEKRRLEERIEAFADRNWELGAEWADSDITIPTAFIAGDHDPVLKMIRPDAIDIMRSHTPDLRLVEIIPDAGHFVQQEQPEATNKAILKFLDSVRAEI